MYLAIYVSIFNSAKLFRLIKRLDIAVSLGRTLDAACLSSAVMGRGTFLKLPCSY